MGKERDSGYYDEIYKNSHHYSLRVNAENTIYNKLYNFVQNRIGKAEAVLEVGCGTGQFAEKLINNGYNYIIGFDFSSEAIKMCNDRCPSGTFLCEDVNIFDFHSISYHTIISLETLEHINNDINVLSKIRKGKRVILSLPSFDDPSHVRFFTTANDIEKYYKDVLSNIKVYKIDRHFVVDAISS